ncbi:MAG: ORF6N domain-containing protein [Bacilli bacterium]|nr:ORF6N domain-containing protein [Bacilli bacterium]
MNEIIEKEKMLIEDMIYEVRGVQVMLDSDIAKLYCVETKRVNEAVKNNPDKFPERFSFVITDLEKNNLWSKFSTANISSKSRTNPRVFTEQGLYMLATILKSKVATAVSIAIMDTFVKMRHYINYNKNFLPYKFMLLENKVDDNTKRINELFNKFDPKVIVKDYIFFEGDFYDAYSLFLDILSLSQEEIIIIDNYAGKNLLDLLKNIDKKIIIVSKNIDEILKKKYEEQYNNITFVNNHSFHDRFIIIDRKKLYSCGASFKDLGKKCFTINELNDEFYLNRILRLVHL